MRQVNIEIADTLNIFIADSNIYLKVGAELLIFFTSVLY